MTDSATFSTPEATDEDLGDLLLEVLPPDGSTIGNLSAREALGRAAERQISEEEFEAVKDMARLAREENEALNARISALEAKAGLSPPPGKDDRPDISDMRLDG